MKRMLAVILIILFGFVGFAYAQSATDVYKAVKRAELSATGNRAVFASAMTDAETEFDIFKDSPEAKKNPEFTTHIKKALGGLALAQIWRNPDMLMGFVLMEQKKGKGNAGPEPATRWKEGMDTASRELALAKKYMGLIGTGSNQSEQQTINTPDILSKQAIKYSNRIDELHSRMKNEFNILAQSGPQNAVAVSTVVIPNVKKLIAERDNLKFEAVKYYHGKLPPDLANKFEESERFTDLARKTMQNAGAQW
jgi:hypothetical protein